MSWGKTRPVLAALPCPSAGGGIWGVLGWGIGMGSEVRAPAELCWL